MRWSYSPREELRRPFDRPPDPVSFVVASAAGRGVVPAVWSDSAVSTASAVSLVVVVAAMASMEVTSVVSGVGGGAGSGAGVTAPASRDARA